jgi:hypothetical protein
MSASFRVRYAVFFRRWAMLCPQRLGTSAAVATLALLIAGCAAAPRQTLGGPDPSDSDVRVPAVRYRSTISPFSSQRPVEPTAWREQNERVAPAPKQ